jgi:hypothetical protein
MNHKGSIDDQKAARGENKDNSTINTKNPDSLNLTLNDEYDKVLAIPDDSLRKMVKEYGLTRYVNLTLPSAPWYTKFIIKQVFRNRLQSSGTFSENMQKTIPKLIFILIPLIALLLKLLFVRKRIPYFNHLIFSLHFLSFFFLLLFLTKLGSRISDSLDWVVYVLLMVYLYFALLWVYRQKKWKTFAKFLLLFFGSLFMLAFFFLIAVSISFILI